METDNTKQKRIFCPLGKKSKAKNKKYNKNFQNVVIFNSVPEEQRDLQTSKYLAINLTMVAYGNWENTITFAKTNNCDLLRVLKH